LVVHPSSSSVFSQCFSCFQSTHDSISSKQSLVVFSPPCASRPCPRR
jgi:hypothetical protein